jgi:hypothetical protein
LFFLLRVSNYCIELLAAVCRYVSSILLPGMRLVLQAFSGTRTLHRSFVQIISFCQFTFHCTGIAVQAPVWLKQDEQQKQCAEKKKQITLHTYFEKLQSIIPDIVIYDSASYHKSMYNLRLNAIE